MRNRWVRVGVAVHSLGWKVAALSHSPQRIVLFHADPLQFFAETPREVTGNQPENRVGRGDASWLGSPDRSRRGQ
jgi:hypothetical protein